MSHYQHEFPDFDDAASMDQLIAAGWRDDSWHNDVCPKVVHPSGLLHIWVEFKDTEQRESGCARFILQRVDLTGDGWCDGDDIEHSEHDLPAVLRAADEWLAKVQKA